ncbi:MAG: hypothetical protein J6R79_05175 [Bacteroidaceae bacterium]|nr:hypothetical protein [Bacteroidaceae bacterium]
MRKITSLLMLFCMSIGMAWAGPEDLPEITTDVNNPIYYTIYNTRSEQPGGLMYYAGDEVGLKDGGCTSQTLEDKYKFFFTGSYDALYVHNAATSMKLASVSSWTEEGAVWAVAVSPKGGGLAFGPQGGLNGNECWNEKNYQTDENTSDFTIWSANDAGSIFIAEKASEYVFPETGKFYVIECPLFNKVKGVQKGLYVNSEGVPAWNTIDLADKAYYWVPTVNGDGTVSLMNLSTNTYLNGTEMSDVPASATLNALGSGSFKIVVNGVTVHAAGHNSGNGQDGSIVSWNGAAGSASAWTFAEKNDPDAATKVDVVYSFTYDGFEIYSQTTTTLVGEEYPNFTVTLPHGVSAVKPEGVIENGDVVGGEVRKEIEMTVELPFEFASDYASINKWYFIQMHSSGGTYSRYIQAMEDHIEWLDVEMDINELDSYTWAFIGDPFNGFKLVNYAAGETLGVNSTGEGNPVLDDIETATVWQIYSSETNPEARYFCFKYPDNNQFMNAQNGKIAFWGSRDQGSTMWVTERDFSGATDLQAVIDQVEALVDAGVMDGTTVGYITNESLDNITAAYEAALEAVTSKVGCLEAQIALQEAVAAAKTVQPEEGKFYTIASAMPNTDARSGQKMYVNNDGGMNFNNVESAMANVFQFVSDGAGKFFLKSVERGTFMNSAKPHNGGQSTATATVPSEAKAIAIANMGRENVVSLIPEGGAMIHAQAAGSQVVAWNNSDNAGASAWVISEVNIEDFAHELAIDASGYATLVLGYDAVIPEGVKAYAVTETAETSVTLTEIVGAIPANEAVVVCANEGSEYFVYAESAAEVANNLLEGSVFNLNVEESAYILATKENGTGFYKAMLNVSTNTENDGTEEVPAVTFEAFKNNAFKAYLPVASASPVLRMNFGAATAIENITTVLDVNAPIYDLAGRRVNAATKGIFIQNGKKIVVK